MGSSVINILHTHLLHHIFTRLSSCLAIWECRLVCSCFRDIIDTTPKVWGFLDLPALRVTLKWNMDSRLTEKEKVAIGPVDPKFMSQLQLVAATQHGDHVVHPFAGVEGILIKENDRQWWIIHLEPSSNCTRTLLPKGRIFVINYSSHALEWSRSAELAKTYFELYSQEEYSVNGSWTSGSFAIFFRALASNAVEIVENRLM